MINKIVKTIEKAIEKEITKNKELLEIIFYSDEAYVEVLLYIDVLSDLKNKIKSLTKNKVTTNELFAIIREQKEKVKQEGIKIEYRFLKTIYAAIAFVESKIKEATQNI